MKVWVDFYKPTGKWYAGGVVEMAEVQAYASPEEKLEMLWSNQKIMIVHEIADRLDWTIVLDDLDSNRNNPEYHTLWKRVLQIGKEVE